MIRTYVYDALVGEDREHAWELLQRKAHPRVYLLYYFARAARVMIVRTGVWRIWTHSTCLSATVANGTC